MNIQKSVRRLAFSVTLFTFFATGVVAQTLCKHCEDQYNREKSACRGDKHCLERALDRRNECMWICQGQK